MQAWISGCTDQLRESRLGISFNQSKQNPAANKYNLALLKESCILSTLIMAELKWTTSILLSNIPVSYMEKPPQQQDLFLAVLGLCPTIMSGGQRSPAWTSCSKPAWHQHKPWASLAVMTTQSITARTAGCCYFPHHCGLSGPAGWFCSHCAGWGHSRGCSQPGTELELEHPKCSHPYLWALAAAVDGGTLFSSLLWDACSVRPLSFHGLARASFQHGTGFQEDRSRGCQPFKGWAQNCYSVTSAALY